jgi:hypothetical protein
LWPSLLSCLLIAEPHCLLALRFGRSFSGRRRRLFLCPPLAAQKKKKTTTTRVVVTARILVAYLSDVVRGQT